MELHPDEHSVKLARTHELTGRGRLFQERGFRLLSTQDERGAMASFEQAVNINAALLPSWIELARLYRAAGDLHKADVADEQVAVLGRLPSPVVEAGSLFSDGEPIRAEKVLRAHLLEGDTHVEALRLLGRIVHQRGALEDAQQLLARAMALSPDYQAARADYARVLIEQQDYVRAREQLTALLKLEPGNWDYCSLNATVCAGLGDYEGAINGYREILARTPGWPQLHLLLGNSLKAVGRAAEAIAAYRAAAALRPELGDAYWSLANLKTYRFGTDEIVQMRVAEAAPATASVDRYHLCFALGKAYEDRDEYAQSWHFYERGNALKHAQCRYDPQRMQTYTRQQMEVCSVDFFSARAGAGTLDRAPIFIVGLPRAGSTLVEQILSSHSQIESTRELPTLEQIAGSLPYPEALATVERDEFRKLGERYLHETGAYRNGGRRFFIDKMPGNFRHIGLIHLMLPQARIIDVRREPLACCFSNLKQLYARGQEFTYSMDTLADYYRNYLELMRHWDRVLPGKVLHLQYEDLVADPEANVRRALQFCELEFEPGCLEFHRTVRSVSTASSEQVRQPIFRTGLGQWRHFEPWLGSLKDSLGDALTRYRE
jgi:tetratricopeptide (TPR) repeat protein